MSKTILGGNNSIRVKNNKRRLYIKRSKLLDRENKRDWDSEMVTL